MPGKVLSQGPETCQPGATHIQSVQSANYPAQARAQRTSAGVGRPQGHRQTSGAGWGLVSKGNGHAQGTDWLGGMLHSLISQLLRTRSGPPLLNRCQRQTRPKVIPMAPSGDQPRIIMPQRYSKCLHTQMPSWGGEERKGRSLKDGIYLKGSSHFKEKTSPNSVEELDLGWTESLT